MSLTPAQLRVLEQIADGKTRHEAACALHLSIETIKSHLKLIRASLLANTNAHAVAIAMRAGLLV